MRVDTEVTLRGELVEVSAYVTELNSAYGPEVDWFWPDFENQKRFAALTTEEEEEIVSALVKAAYGSAWDQDPRLDDINT